MKSTESATGRTTLVAQACANVQGFTDMYRRFKRRIKTSGRSESTLNNYIRYIVSTRRTPFCNLLILFYPILGQQFIQLNYSVDSQFIQHIFKPVIRVYIMHFACSKQAVKYCGTFCCGMAAGK